MNSFSEKLLAALRQPDYGTCINEVNALYQAAPAELAPSLHGYVFHPAPDVRRRAVQALGFAVPDTVDLVVMSQLTKLKRDRIWTVRDALVRSLVDIVWCRGESGKLDEVCNAACMLLLSLAENDSSETVRDSAIRGLRDLSAQHGILLEAVEDLLFCADQTVENLCRGLRLCAALSFLSEKMKQTISQLLNHPHRKVRIAAARAADFPYDELLPSLIRRAYDGDFSVRAAAFNTLDKRLEHIPENSLLAALVSDVLNGKAPAKILEKIEKLLDPAARQEWDEITGRRVTWYQGVFEKDVTCASSKRKWTSERESAWRLSMLVQVVIVYA